MLSEWDLRQVAGAARTLRRARRCHALAVSSGLTLSALGILTLMLAGTGFTLALGVIMVVIGAREMLLARELRGLDALTCGRLARNQLALMVVAISYGIIHLAAPPPPAPSVDSVLAKSGLGTPTGGLTNGGSTSLGQIQLPEHLLAQLPADIREQVRSPQGLAGLIDGTGPGSDALAENPALAQIQERLARVPGLSGVLSGNAPGSQQSTSGLDGIIERLNTLTHYAVGVLIVLGAMLVQGMQAGYYARVGGAIRRAHARFPAWVMRVHAAAWSGRVHRTTTPQSDPEYPDFSMKSAGASSQSIDTQAAA